MQNLSPIKEQKDIVTKEYVDKIIMTFIRQPSALANSQELQRMIDSVSANGGGRIRIPAGTYQFASTGKARNIDYCIRMKSNVEIYGDGATTILKPIGATQNGLDMFYFNDYRELNVANYLENCYFHDFAVDGIDATSATYTTAGKGFMFNLMKNCRWDRVIVRNTDGTGIGVDCPIDCSINNCTATGCGKACPDNALNGASGIGIGYGYSNDESMTIHGCEVINNKNWGIFYEHQRRFGATGRQLYPATTNRGLRMSDCSGSMNNVNFGARVGINVSIYNCVSEKGRKHGYELHNCELSQIIGCKSNSEADTSYAVLANNEDGEETESKDITISSCMSKHCKVGVKVFKAHSLRATLKRMSILGNSIYAPSENAVYTYGEIDNLAIQGNASDSNKVEILSTGVNTKNEGNSWNAASSKADRKIIAFGDSYAVGATPPHPSTVESFLSIARRNLGMNETDFRINGKRGAGFSGVSGQFITQIDALADTLGVAECATITDVYICGGANDVAVLHRVSEPYHKTLKQIIADRDACLKEAKIRFPKAKIVIAYVGRLLDPDYIDDWTTMFDVYTNVGQFGVSYMQGIEEALHDPMLMSSDGTHPVQEGYNVLGNYFTQGVIQGYCDVARKADIEMIEPAVQGMYVKQAESNGMISIYVNANSSFTPVIPTHRCAVDNIVLCKLNRSYINSGDTSEWAKWPCTALIHSKEGRSLVTGELSLGHIGLTPVELRLKIFKLNSANTWDTLHNLDVISLKSGPMVISALNC